MYNNQTTEQTTTKGITGSKLDRVQYILIITASTHPSETSLGSETLWL